MLSTKERRAEKKLLLPKPLFDTMQTLDEASNPAVISYLTTLGIPQLEQEYALTREFLRSYIGSMDTFNSYRREVERFLQWAWLVAKKPIQTVNRNDIRGFLEFVQAPPVRWIGLQNAPRFLTSAGQRLPNPLWRPFVARVAKAHHKDGKKPDKLDYQLTPTSLQALFAGLSTFFTFLQQEGYVDANPVQLIRQKRRFIQKQHSPKITRRLSNVQWQCVIEVIESLAAQDEFYERHLFLITIFYLLALRISEVADTPGRIPKMGDFAPDKHDRWWFTTIGKGNKVRDVAVPNAMLEALKRYRTYRGLTPLPSRGENTPLLHKTRGKGGLGTRQVRNLIQACFDKAVEHLHRTGKQDEAQDLATATVHWLRHTAISADVEHRPIKDVRDDAGHENAMITDRYIDADRAARHASAQDKPLKPKMIDNNFIIRDSEQ